MKNKFIILFLFLSFDNLLSSTLTFSKAYELALKNSNNIKSATYKFNSSQEDLNQYKSRLYPQINGSVSYSKSKRELNHELNVSNYEESEKSLDYGISLNQTIYDAEIYSKINVEKKRLNRNDLKLRVNKQDLSREVLKIYVDILKQKNKINLIESKMHYQKYLNESFNKKFKMNLVNKMDMLQAEIDLNTSKIDLKKETQLLYVFKGKLRYLIGIEDFNLPKINYNNTDFLDKGYIETLISDEKSYLNNLKVKELIAEKEYAREEISNARSAYIPKLSLDLNYTDYNSKDISADYENTKKIMLNLNIPIYQGGKVSSKVKSAELLYKSSLEELELIEKESELEYLELKTYLFSSLESFKLYKESLYSATLYLKSVEQAFEYGLKSIIDVSDAKIKVNEIKYNYVDSFIAMIDSYIGLLIMTNDLDKIDSIDKVLEKD